MQKINKERIVAILGLNAARRLREVADRVFGGHSVNEDDLNKGYEFIGLDQGRYYHVVQRPDQVIWGTPFTPAVSRVEINAEEADALQEAGIQLIEVDINTLKPRDSSRRGPDGPVQRLA